MPITVKDSSGTPVSVPTLDDIRGVGGFISVTRPANATPYSIGDVVGGGDGATTTAAFVFTGFSAGEWLITGVDFYEGTTASWGDGAYSLHLYNAAPATVLFDNGAWDLPSGDRAKYLGRIDITAPVDIGSTLRVDTTQVNRQVTLTGTTLIGFLMTPVAYTPASGGVYSLNVHAVKV